LIAEDVARGAPGRLCPVPRCGSDCRDLTRECAQREDKPNGNSVGSTLSRSRVSTVLV
jgi:hypothetical protein